MAQSDLTLLRRSVAQLGKRWDELKTLSLAASSLDEKLDILDQMDLINIRITRIETLRARKPAGIILSGGPKSVSDPGAPVCDPAVFSLETPVLGICYGMQLMAHTLGGTVAPASHREFGHASVRLAGDGAATALFAGVPPEIRVWASHGDFVAAPPPGFSHLAPMR